MVTMLVARCRVVAEGRQGPCRWSEHPTSPRPPSCSVWPERTWRLAAESYRNENSKVGA